MNIADKVKADFPLTNSLSSNNMSFKENSCQQISLTDSFTGLAAREQKDLTKSWAKEFADEIFPSTDEKRFIKFSRYIYVSKRYYMGRKTL